MNNIEDIKKLEDELKYRSTILRDSITSDLIKASDIGDLFRENFPFDDAVAQQRLNEARIVEISDAIKSLKNKKKSEVIVIGSKIKLLRDNNIKELVLVDEDIFKSRIYPNAVTVSSVIGKELLNKGIGDIVNGFEVLEIN